MSTGTWNCQGVRFRGTNSFQLITNALLAIDSLEPNPEFPADHGSFNLNLHDRKQLPNHNGRQTQWCRLVITKLHTWITVLQKEWKAPPLHFASNSTTSYRSFTANNVDWADYRRRCRPKFVARIFSTRQGSDHLHRRTFFSQHAHGILLAFLFCFSTLTGDVKVFPTNFWECQNRAGAAARSENKLFLDPTENCCPPARFRKNSLLLHFWRPLTHKPHIECTSPSEFKIQYICSFSLSRWAMIGVSLSKWNCQ